MNTLLIVPETRLPELPNTSSSSASFAGTSETRQHLFESIEMFHAGEPLVLAITQASDADPNTLFRRHPIVGWQGY